MTPSIETRIYENISGSGCLNDTSRYSLFDGTWGALLFIIYYEQYYSRDQKLGPPLLTQLYNNLSRIPDTNSTYCTGLTGPFRMLHHLSKHALAELDIEEIASDFLHIAVAGSAYYLKRKNYDFLHGSTGIVHFLVPFARQEAVKAHLETFVSSLQKDSRQTDAGLRFPFFHYYTQPPDPKGTDAFSLAHGTCALQIILTRIHHAGIAAKACQELVYESMRFMLHHEKSPALPASLYPAHLGTDQSRVSWCYGDLSIAIALWHCGNYFKEEKWITKALNILYFNAKRNTLAASGVVDPCLCHGTGGNAAIYRRFWQETGDKVLYRCSEDWYALTHKLIRFSDDKQTAGIQTWQGAEKQWKYCWDLLNGSAGTGLALLSRSIPEARSWDELLLIS